MKNPTITTIDELIANPPASTYRSINVGICCYHVWLDFRYRTLEGIGLEVFAPRKSLNIFNRKIERIKGEEPLWKKGEKLLEDILNTYDQRDHLNLGYNGILRDNSPEVKEVIVNTLKVLEESKLLTLNMGNLYFNLPLLKQKKNLEEYLDSIEFYPQRLKKEFTRVIRKNTSEPLKISTLTKYTIKFRTGGEDVNIAPIFVLANLWEIYQPRRITFPISNNVLTKYALLRYLTQIAVNDSPGFDILYAYPRVIYEKSIEENFDEFIKDEFNRDFFRVACAKIHSLKEQKVNLGKDDISYGRKLVYAISNISKYFISKNILFDIENESIEPNYNLLFFDYKNEINSIEKKLRSIKRDLNNYKSQRNISKISSVFSEYMNLVYRLRPIIPKTVELVLSRLKKKSRGFK